MLHFAIFHCLKKKKKRRDFRELAEVAGPSSLRPPCSPDPGGIALQVPGVLVRSAIVSDLCLLMSPFWNPRGCFLVERATDLQPLSFGRLEMLWRWQSDAAFAVCATSDRCSRPCVFNTQQASVDNAMILATITWFEIWNDHPTGDFVAYSLYNPNHSCSPLS